MPSHSLGTYAYFKLGKRGHVNDANRLLTALDFGTHNIKPVRFVKGFALIQIQQI